MAFAIKNLDHVVVCVSDLERALAFYCGVLGCAEERRIDSLGLVQLRAGASLIDLLLTPGGPVEAVGRPDGGHNMDHFCVRIEPFDPPALRSHLESHGIEVGEVVQRYGAEGHGPSLYIQDPDGNTVELKGPPAAD